MARLGRAQPGYRSGHSFLRPPEVVTGPPPVETTVRRVLAPKPQVQRYRSLYFGITPQVVSPAVPPAPVETTLRRTLAQTERRPGKSFLRPPAVVDPAPPVETTLQLALVRIRPPLAGAKLSPPAVVADPPVETTVRRVLAPKPQAQRYRSLYFGTIPQVVDPAVPPPPVETTVRLSLAQIRPAPTSSKLFAPAAVDPPPQPPVETTVRRFLAPKPQTQRYRSIFFGLIPLVVDPAEEQGPPPIETVIRRALTKSRPVPTKSIVRPPATLEPPAAQPPVSDGVRVSLAAQIPRGFGRHRKAGWSIGGPQVVNVFEGEGQRTPRLVLAPPRPRRLTRAFVRAPQVLAPPPPVETTVRTAFALPPRKRWIRSLLQRPQAVTSDAQAVVSFAVFEVPNVGGVGDLRTRMTMGLGT